MEIDLDEVEEFYEIVFLDLYCRGFEADTKAVTVRLFWSVQLINIYFVEWIG